MASRVSIQPLKILNVRTGRESFEIKLYIDEYKTYLSANEIPDDDIQLLKDIKDLVDNDDDGDIDSALNIIKDMQEVTIGDKRYTWEEIKDVFAEEDDEEDDEEDEENDEEDDEE